MVKSNCSDIFMLLSELWSLLTWPSCCLPHHYVVAKDWLCLCAVHRRGICESSFVSRPMIALLARRGMPVARSSPVAEPVDSSTL